MKQKIRFRMRYTNLEVRCLKTPTDRFQICPEELVRPGRMHEWVAASGMYRWPIVGRRVS